MPSLAFLLCGVYVVAGRKLIGTWVPIRTPGPRQIAALSASVLSGVVVVLLWANEGARATATSGLAWWMQNGPYTGLTGLLVVLAVVTAITTLNGP